MKWLIGIVLVVMTLILAAAIFIVGLDDQIHELDKEKEEIDGESKID